MFLACGIPVANLIWMSFFDCAAWEFLDVIFKVDSVTWEIIWIIFLKKGVLSFIFNEVF